MKLLIVFVSALVLVAHGNIIPSEEFAESPTVLDAEIEPSLGSPQVSPRVYDVEETADEHEPIPESGVYIPSVTRICNNAGCANVCHRLGFRFGLCTSLSTCWCHN